MNNYFKNQLSRTKCGLLLRVKYHIMAILRPGELRRMWHNHSVDMQNELNGEHDIYRGWWVADHEYHYDRNRWTKDGFGCYWPLFE